MWARVVVHWLNCRLQMFKLFGQKCSQGLPQHTLRQKGDLAAVCKQFRGVITWLKVDDLISCRRYTHWPGLSQNGTEHVKNRTDLVHKKILVNAVLLAIKSKMASEVSSRTHRSREICKIQNQLLEAQSTFRRANVRANCLPALPLCGGVLKVLAPAGDCSFHSDICF